MAQVQFEIDVCYDHPPRAVWDELIDWAGHEAWIPATRVEVDGPDPTAVGASFTAWTGLGPLTLEDRMRVTRCDWEDDDQRGVCEVEKLGPVLRGRAGFTVGPVDDRTEVRWLEDVHVPRLPRLLSPVAARLGALGFRLGMRRLNRQLSRPLDEVRTA